MLMMLMQCFVLYEHWNIFYWDVSKLFNHLWSLYVLGKWQDMIYGKLIVHVPSSIVYTSYAHYIISLLYWWYDDIRNINTLSVHYLPSWRNVITIIIFNTVFMNHLLLRHIITVPYSGFYWWSRYLAVWY